MKRVLTTTLLTLTIALELVVLIKVVHGDFDSREGNVQVRVESNYSK